MFEILIIVFAALALDYLMGEPSRLHPLVGFGWLASFIERRMNPLSSASDDNDQPQVPAIKRNGVLAWLIVVVPFVILAAVMDYFARTVSWLYPTFAMFVLYLAIGRQSLVEHARAIAEPLAGAASSETTEDRDAFLADARFAVSMIVSRDTESLDETAVASAATESVLENGADAIFSAIFWFCVAGVPGVVLYRLSNTLDAMWGYKNTRFLQFGWAAARIDDVLNYIPARLTALAYSLAGNTRSALRCWRKQGAVWKSPNAGPVMAAGAGAINTQLGGGAIYHGQISERPSLGEGGAPSADSIYRALSLVDKGIFIWLLVMAGIGAVFTVLGL